MNIFDRSVSSEVGVTLDKEGRDMISLLGLMGVDMSWLKSAKLGMDIAVKDNLYNYTMSTSLNGEDILSYNMLLDLAKGDMYFRLPEMNKSYVCLEADSYMSGSDEDWEQLTDWIKMYEEVRGAMPDRARMEKLMNKYLQLAVESVDKVSKDKEALEVEELKMNCTEFKVTIDGETMQKILEAVLTEAQKDKDIKKLIMAFGDTEAVQNASEMDGDELYEAFQDAIDDLLDEIEDLEDSKEKITMKVYVDGKGNVMGRTFEYKDYWGRKNTLDFLTLEKGSKFGYEMGYQSGSNKIKLSGSGKVNKGNLTGEFKLKYSGASLLECKVKNLNKEELKRGRMNGTLEFGLTSGAANLLADNRDLAPIKSMLKDIALVLNGDCTKNNYKWTLSVKYDEKSVGNISLATKIASSPKVSIPSKKEVIVAEDEDDFQEWIEDFDWKGLIRKLDKIDVPSEWIDAIEELQEDAEDGYLRPFRGGSRDASSSGSYRYKYDSGASASPW